MATINSKRAYYESIFRKYDKDHSGTIDIKELTTMLQEDNDVSHKIVKKLIKYNDKNGDGKIDIDEFTNMLLDKKFKKLFRRYVNSYVNFVVPRNKLYRVVTLEGETYIDSPYEEGISFWPPPACMVLMSIIEIICFVVNKSYNNDQPDERGPLAIHLIYDPFKRQQCWRFLTYMLVHIGKMHLIVNLIVQILLGIPLELRNRWYRVLPVYLSGIVAGSLLSSIVDPSVFLAGASGGVYAILTAHIANVIINFREMSFPLVQLFIFGTTIFADISVAIYNRYNTSDEAISYAAHLGGAVAGLLVGIWALKNVEPTEKEKYLWWIAFLLYFILMGVAIMLNIFWTEHFQPSKWL
ncbi:rhomboid-related protein 2-like isoform X2 [Anthonomus grandis grandis]|uniref:rhomboid-related protein 2-like isoform X2 n=1 Tax=Anthonomus grandis grandis TaxID=2921223 RepID=UPI002166788F|nr:rhomboid-related protein 2-like isoform X2 [Anthonomus grandis grandis]XP_050315816.1 rhomboid-related protein 2-like isoform X2 [Anthonomus grandis grandis]